MYQSGNDFIIPIATHTQPCYIGPILLASDSFWGRILCGKHMSWGPSGP